MKKLSLYHKDNWRRGWLLSLFAVLFLGLALSTATRSWAEDEEEEVVEEAPTKSSKAKAEDDSLADLEKVIDDGSDESEISVKEDRQAKAEEDVEEAIDDGEEVVEEPPSKAPVKAKAPPRNLAEDEEKELEDTISDDEESVAKEEVPPPPPVAKPVPPPKPVQLAKPAPPPPLPPPAPTPPKKTRVEVAVRNQITNLEFKMDGPKSRIVVTFRDTPIYREERNDAIKQVVYAFENTETPNRLQRAYDTSEFASPVNIFTLLQMPGSDRPLSKLIVQLRETKSPQVTATTNGLYIDFPAPDKKYEPKIVVGDDENSTVEENIYASGRTFSGKRIQRLEVKNSDVQDVLRLIAKTSGYNIVVGDDVTGKVGTLSLENIPWDQAFTLVLQSKKLGYVKQGSVIRVGTLGSLKAEKEEALANEASRIKVEPLKTVLIPVSYAKANDISPRAKNFLTERGSLDVDVRTNTVIVKDVDKTITRVQKLISALDTQPPRVSISARIVEMLTSFTRQIGFQNHTLNATLAGINLGQTIGLGDTSNFTTTLSAPQLANLTTVFTMGESENKVKILAAPSVTVVANQQANVTQSNSFFVPVTEFVNGVQAFTVRQFTATLSLDVTPIVAGDGSIFMTLNVRNEIPRGAGTERTVDTRSVNTQVLLENGDTAVIGGIFNNTVNATRLGVPFFSKLPVIGLLFNSNNLEDSRNEIFIFLTAKILNAEESFKRNF